VAGQWTSTDIRHEEYVEKQEYEGTKCVEISDTAGTVGGGVGADVNV
jgi:hypothetical protein